MFTFNLKAAIFFIALSSVIIFSQNPLLNEHSVKFENSTTVSLVGENGLIMKTTDNGVTWVEQSSNISNILFGASFNSGISLAAGENGVILRSIDNGENWQPILPGTTENLNDIEIVGSKAAVCGNNGTIYYSADYGENWTVTNSNTTNNLYDIKFINAETGFITGDLGTLLKTTDGGISWQSIEISFTNAKFNSIEAIDADNLIIIGDAGKIFLSNDGGSSWYGPNGFMYEANLNDVVFFNSNEGVIAGDNGLLLRTNDGGMSWTQADTYFSGDLYDLKAVSFYDANNGISVGGNGIEVYTTNGGVSWTDTAPIKGLFLTNSTKKSVLQLSQNYPNPFNPSTKIKYDLPFNANVTLKVYDIAGREVASLVTAYQNSGAYSVNFDASSLSSGVYIYKLSVTNSRENITKVNKMILTK